MENFIFYLGKASLLLAIFFLPYYFLLRKETFFNANRWFLLTGIVASLVLPFFVFTKIIFVEPIATDFQIPLSNAVEFIPMEESAFEINWIHIAFIIYFLGVLFFFIRFFRDIFSLRKILKDKEIQKQEGFRLINTDKIQSPFSFFRYIVYNSKVFDPEELKNIIAHEKVHSSQFHSADMILGQLLCIFFWFNPIAWLHQKAVSQNLEFIADSIALKQVSDKINYQKTLLKVSAPHLCIPVTNHFFQSLIKKRIVMLNKNQSKKTNSWKYATVLPLITIFMLQFQVETVAQVKKTTISEKSTSDNKEVIAYSESNLSTDSVQIDYQILEKQNQVDHSENDQEKLFVLNGNKFKNVKSITIPDGETVASLVDLNSIEAQKKYGIDGKNGAIEIITKKETGKVQETKPTQEAQQSGYSMSFKLSTSEETFTETLKNPNIDLDKVLVIIDEKEASIKEFEALDHEKIMTVSSTGKASPGLQKLIDKYGEKAKNGVISVGTKEVEIVYGIDGTKDSKLINDNSGFLIDKNSKEKDLEFYKSEFLKSNIIFKYKAKRNNSDQIKSLSIEISDKTGAKKQIITRQFKFDKEEDVISEVFVGRRNGYLVISGTKKD